MRVGVAFAGLPVSGPARMPDPNFSGKRLAGDKFFQIFKFAHVPPQTDLRIFDDGDARTVISPVFEPFQAAQDNGRCAEFPNVANNTTHIQPLFVTEIVSAEYQEAVYL